jgi:hypothetical protein
MARLSVKARKKLPASTFAGPNRSFPLNDANHVRAAKSLERFASPATKAKINAKAKTMGIGTAKKKTAAKKRGGK